MGPIYIRLVYYPSSTIISFMEIIVCNSCDVSCVMSQKTEVLRSPGLDWFIYWIEVEVLRSSGRIAAVITPILIDI